MTELTAARPDDGTGLLVLAGTPIGQADYAAPVLAASLAAADLVAAEDSRRLVKLCQRRGWPIPGRIVSYFDGNETERTPELLAALTGGATVVLVTDAGLPSVSDPGYRLVAAAIAAGVRVTAVPGPSAALTALIVSGLPVDRFCFEGFAPRQAGPRRARLTDLATEGRTMVFFEAPHRLADFLNDAAASFGPDRPGAICRELTKPHEEIIRGTLADLAAWAAGEVRGEITVVIGGSAGPDVGLAELVGRVQELIELGDKRSRAVARVAAAAQYDRRALYDAVLAAGPAGAAGISSVR